LALSVVLSVSAVSTPSMIQPTFHNVVHLMVVVILLTRILAIKTERYVVLPITSSRYIQFYPVH
jgi:branched-subunit amino acid transport protein